MIIRMFFHDLFLLIFAVRSFLFVTESVLLLRRLRSVLVASVVRWLKRCEPLRHRSKPATRIDMDALAQDVIDYPDACHCERAARFGVSQAL